MKTAVRIIFRVFPAALLFSGALLLSAAVYTARAQTVSIDRDPQIADMVKAVSADHLRQLVQELAGFGTRHTLSDTTSDSRGIGAARRWIKAELERYARESGGRLMVEYDSYVQEGGIRRVEKATEIKNVIAILPGVDTADKRVFIVSGHYDSRNSDVSDAVSDAPGANDDCSGTAAVMEMARIMSKHRFKATIIFACVAGEEQGLLGSGHLAARAKQEGWQVAGMITNDIVGNSQGSGTLLRDNTRVRVFSEGIPVAAGEKEIARIRQLGMENDSPSRQLARYLKELGERYVDHLEIMLIYRPDRFLRGGDHLPFSREGFPAIRVTEMNEHFRYQHQDVRTENGLEYGDLVQHVDFEYLRKVTAMNMASLANLAASPGPPEQVQIIMEGLSNETVLAWKAPQSQDPTLSYYVLIRETSSPVWQKKIRVPATRVRLPYSKDNYFFAVQAVDAAGHESLPVFPLPAQAE
ncbi:M28 family metallopeptidase [Anseongella ginsenosidimutans]|nr:M28 family metallopeptidase [Anseongella ginsenosidimutans]QEC51514.1 M20/M25/M40 family metallo-hydrolase [Anseongella ginsenosidimutans]